MELKRKLDGRTMRYACEPVEMGPAFAMLLYRHPVALSLAGVAIPAGSRSYGLYWTDRPYNVYHWVAAEGETLACYCNAATETRIAPASVEWLDLEADVLITPDGRGRVLDLEEVPDELSPPHRAALAGALRALADGPAVLAEARTLTARATGPRA